MLLHAGRDFEGLFVAVRRAAGREPATGLYGAGVGAGTGITRRSPETITLGFLSWLAAMICATETPYSLAMPWSVSPERTTWTTVVGRVVGAGEGAGVGAGVGGGEDAGAGGEPGLAAGSCDGVTVARLALGVGECSVE